MQARPGTPPSPAEPAAASRLPGPTAGGKTAAHSAPAVKDCAAPSPRPDIPRHIAIIMDGNGRWARQRGLPRLDGHREGVDAIPRVLDFLTAQGVQYLTLYAFSTENWLRPPDEVSGILQLFQESLQQESNLLMEKNIRVFHLGQSQRLSSDLRHAIDQVQQQTAANTGLILNLAFDYGGRQEILAAVQRLMQDSIPPDELDETLFGRYLFTAHCPDPDLIIRTGGELRISNFLLWQSAYSEYYSTATLWPDLDAADLKDALDSYARRQRRFGRVHPES